MEHGVLAHLSAIHLQAVKMIRAKMRDTGELMRVRELRRGQQQHTPPRDGVAAAAMIEEELLLSRRGGDDGWRILNCWWDRRQNEEWLHVSEKFEEMIPFFPRKAMKQERQIRTFGLKSFLESGGRNATEHTAQHELVPKPFSLDLQRPASLCKEKVKCVRQEEDDEGNEEDCCWGRMRRRTRKGGKEKVTTKKVEVDQGK